MNALPSVRPPVAARSAVLSVSPVVLPTPDRVVDLHLRVSAPVTGSDLPVLLLSHGQGFSHHLSSSDGYAPLVNHYAAHGFVVVQPTHLSSTSLTLPPGDPEAPMYWRSRAQDLVRILDRIDEIEAAVPELAGRMDRSRVAAVGHSMGGHTVSLLLGARLTDPADGQLVDLTEPRISAGVLLAAPGRGGEALTGTVATAYPFLASTDFSHMTTPTLVVAGDRDDSAHLTVAGAGWHADPHHLSPGPTSLVTLFGGEHGLGGVSGYDVAETTDEDVDRVAAVQRLTTAYLRTALYPDDPAWPDACAELAAADHPAGRIESKDTVPAGVTA